MEHIQGGSQMVTTGYSMQPSSFPMSGAHGGGPFVVPQRMEKFVTRAPGVLTETKIKDEPNFGGEMVRDHEVADYVGSHAELQNLLMCTEMLQSEEQFHTNENSSTAESSKGPAGGKGSKLNHKQQSPAVANMRRVNKVSVLTSASVSRGDKSVKKSASTVATDKRRQSRPRRSVEEPIIREVTVVDEQSVEPLSDVVGDLDFEDLEPEDLDLVRHLPPPGNVNIVDRCGVALQMLHAFERRLQDVLHYDSRGNLGDDADHDSDATLSIMSDDGPGDAPHSAGNPATNMSMLLAYKMVFDPPVPAVVTIPTSIVKLNGTEDWKTESEALQYLMKKTADLKSRSVERSKKRKREEDSAPATTKRDDYLKRLVAAIEIKSNKVVHLKQAVFTLQHALPEKKKPCTAKPELELVVEKNSSTEKLAKSSSDQAMRNGALLKKFRLEAMCESFLQASLPSLQQEELRKAFSKKSQLEKLWNQRLASADPSLQKELGEILQDTQMHLKELGYGKERAEMVVDEKFILDAEDTEKRLQGATEKAKSHVINMFEENRRQYELQRTLDYATCKYDMLSINTRNMRRRADVPSHSRLDDLPSSSAGNPSGSPPHSSQSSMPLVGSQMRRRRNHFASVLKDSLEDKEIYDDLSNITRMVKEDPERDRSRMMTKSADVIPDNNRLTVDGKVFHRNQPVMVEKMSFDGNALERYPGTLLQFSHSEIVVKRHSDGRVERDRFPVGSLMDRRVILKKRSINPKNNYGNSK